MTEEDMIWSEPERKVKDKYIVWIKSKSWFHKLRESRLGIIPKNKETSLMVEKSAVLIEQH